MTVTTPVGTLDHTPVPRRGGFWASSVATIYWVAWGVRYGLRHPGWHRERTDNQSVSADEMQAPRIEIEAGADGTRAMQERMRDELIAAARGWLFSGLRTPWAYERRYGATGAASDLREWFERGAGVVEPVCLKPVTANLPDIYFVSSARVIGDAARWYRTILESAELPAVYTDDPVRHLAEARWALDETIAGECDPAAGVTLALTHIEVWLTKDAESGPHTPPRVPAARRHDIDNCGRCGHNPCVQYPAHTVFDSTYPEYEW